MWMGLFPTCLIWPRVNPVKVVSDAINGITETDSL